MSVERFNVVVFDRQGYWWYADRQVNAEQAVRSAHRCVCLAEAGGTAAKIIITDDDDFTNFQWEHGKGIVYPEPRQ
jgi:hypothetical protein